MNKMMGSSKDTEMRSGCFPKWAVELVPVRKLPTNVGSRIRNCVYRALEKDPPKWAKKRLEVSISKEVYKGNACGPTKRAVVSVLCEVEEKIAQEMVEEKVAQERVVEKIAKEKVEEKIVLEKEKFAQEKVEEKVAKEMVVDKIVQEKVEEKIGQEMIEEKKRKRKKMRKVAICLQCGDAGCDEYVYCFKCAKFAVHSYCLPELPKTSDEIVRWLCDDCEAMSSGSARKKVQGNTQDGRSTESVISTSPSGSNKTSISPSSLEEDENYGQNELPLQSVHENLGSIGNARLADEPNASNNWSQKDNIPVKHERQRDTSQPLDGVEEVKVAVDESLQTTNLNKKSEVFSSFSGKDYENLPTTSDQKPFHGELRPEEVDEVLADNLSKRPKFIKTSDISSPVLEKEKQRQTTTAPSRFSSLRDGDCSTNSARIHGVKSIVSVAEGSSQRTKLDVKRNISTSVIPKEKQIRWPSSPDQLQSRQLKQLGDHSLRYPPSHNKRNRDRSRFLLNIAKQRYIGSSSWKTREAGRPVHNTVRDERKKDRSRSLLNIAKQRYSVPSSRQVREAVRPMHIIACKREKEHLKEESLQTHDLKNLTHYTFCTSCKEHAKVIISPPVSELIGYPIQVQPVADPIWWGRFDIVNKKYDTLGGFVAHLSSRACQQVIEEARLLPALLELEMVPVSGVWPKSFQTTEPSDDNIALYLFPSDRRYERLFDRLVLDMSDHELAMRTITKNAELLIFSSTKLPIKYWRFQNNYFIWGVFKAKRSISSDIHGNRGNTNLGYHVTVLQNTSHLLIFGSRHLFFYSLLFLCIFCDDWRS